MIGQAPAHAILQILEKAIQSYQAGRLQEAERLCRHVLCLEPARFDPTHILSIVHHYTGRQDSSVALLRRATRINRSYVQAHINLGVNLMLAGQTDDAIESFGNALAVDPRCFQAKFNRCIARLPAVFHSADHIEQARDAYRSDLERLVIDVLRDSRDAAAGNAAAIGTLQPFYLAYQGRCDRELQQLYGHMCHHLMAARYPAFGQRPPMPPRAAGEPIRVGILSGFFSNHSNWKIRIRSWLEKLGPGIAIFGYYTRGVQDGDTALARSLCHRFREGGRTIEQWAQAIRSDRLHMLIIPEIGMDQTTVQLAALRLAPLQATSWGHPDTSGLPTIDYYLSSALMEPDHADAHYSETLVKLPNIGFYYIPRPLDKSFISRQDFKIGSNDIVYWCCQSFAKYLPQFDFVFPRIAKEVRNAKFIFIRSYLPGNGGDSVFQARLDEAFRRQGLDAAAHCLFLPHMSNAAFNGISALSDVCLDTFHWSGCNTTLETLAHHLPLVTLPGDLMRGRHSFAILTMIGVTETIAASVEDYIAIAVRLGRDKAWRRRIARKIADNLPRAYEDMAAIDGLRGFIEEAVDAATPD